jgi:predicted ATP-grasp superfamily ATP-dependent carboligase
MSVPQHLRDKAVLRRSDEPAEAVLIASLSGRSLAASARRAGYAPLVADLFGDLDTREIAENLVRVRGSIATGFSGPALHTALDRLTHRDAAPLGLVYGSGFEDRPDLLAALGVRHGLLGNPAAVVARTKNPVAMAALCARLGVPHPALGTGCEHDGWLDKRIGGSGGAHVQPAQAGVARRPGTFRQRFVPGRPVSALFLADGRRSQVLGFSEQWTNAAPGAPFRYGGALRPVGFPIPRPVMLQAVALLADALGLVGLNSADFLATEDHCTMLEINPRAGASLDVFPSPKLFGLHLDACAGRLPAAVPALPGADAAAVVYAPHPIQLQPGFSWPEWTADRQPARRVVKAGAPLCTVLAAAGTPAAARALVAARATELLVRAAQHAS